MLQCVQLLFKNHIYVIHTCIHTYIHAYIHTYIHTVHTIKVYLHTLIHTYIHTYVQIDGRVSGGRIRLQVGFELRDNVNSDY